MRKETTITSLRTRVEELEKTIDKMQNLFYELHDAAMNPELNGQDTYRESINQLADRFQTLQAATAGAFASEEAGDSHHEEEGEQKNQHKRERIPSSRDIPTLAKRRSHDSDDGSGPNDASKGIGLGMANFTMQLTTSRGKTTSRFGSSNSSGSGGGSYSGTSSVVSSYQNARSRNYPSSQTTTTTTLQLRDDFSFSLRDASFSKRLHRAALEYAYGLLTSPAVDQRAIDRVFAYSFCYKTKDDIIKSIATILNCIDPYIVDYSP